MLQRMAIAEAAMVKRFPALSSRFSRPVVSVEERLQAAEALRERLSSAPWYAARAAKARAAGDEMAFWLDLQSSRMTAHRL